MANTKMNNSNERDAFLNPVIKDDRGDKELANYKGWFEHICQSGDEVCEQAFSDEHEFYQVMEEGSDKDTESEVDEFLRLDRTLEYTNDLGGEPDPGWSEDEPFVSEDLSYSTHPTKD